MHWTAVTSTVHRLQYSDHPTEIAKAAFRRTVCLDVRLIYNLFMLIRGGRDPQRMHEYGFDIPPGKYNLADAGFPSCNELLIPYRNVRYHLAEWGRANARYVTRN